MNEELQKNVGALLTQAQAKYLYTFLEELKKKYLSQLLNCAFEPEISVSKDGKVTTVINNIMFAKIKATDSIIAELNFCKDLFEQDKKSRDTL